MKTLLLLLALVAASPCPAAEALPRPQSRFALIDARSGKPFSEKELSGKVQLVFFGFTHCRLICPLGMQRISETLQVLGSKSGGVSALFITTDPKRDTGPVMKAYASHFNPGIIPLHGDETATKAAMKAFRLEAHKTEIRSESDYQMDHPALFYLFDKQGLFAKSVSSSISAKELAKEISRLLN